MGRTGEAISLGVTNWSARADQFVKQVETTRSSDLIVRRLRREARDPRERHFGIKETSIRIRLPHQPKSEKALSGWSFNF